MDTVVDHTKPISVTAYALKDDFLCHHIANPCLNLAKGPPLLRGTFNEFREWLPGYLFIKVIDSFVYLVLYLCILFYSRNLFYLPTIPSLSKFCLTFGSRGVATGLQLLMPKWSRMVKTYCFCEIVRVRRPRSHVILSPSSRQVGPNSVILKLTLPLSLLLSFVESAPMRLLST